MKNQEFKPVISKELAIQEVGEYLSDYVNGVFDVENDYPNILNAVMFGRLSFKDGVSTYKLIEPINSGTEFAQNEVTFKTRVKPSDTARLAKGIDLKNDTVKYGLVVTAHVVGLASYYELDNFCKKDYLLIQELAPVFT